MIVCNTCDPYRCVAKCNKYPEQPCNKIRDANSLYGHIILAINSIHCEPYSSPAKLAISCLEISFNADITAIKHDGYSNSSSSSPAPSFLLSLFFLVLLFARFDNKYCCISSCARFTSNGNPRKYVIVSLLGRLGRLYSVLLSVVDDDICE